MMQGSAIKLNTDFVEVQRLQYRDSHPDTRNTTSVSLGVVHLEKECLEVNTNIFTQKENPNDQGVDVSGRMQKIIKIITGFVHPSLHHQLLNQLIPINRIISINVTKQQ